MHDFRPNKNNTNKMKSISSDWPGTKVRLKTMKFGNYCAINLHASKIMVIKKLQKHGKKSNYTSGLFWCLMKNGEQRIWVR
jgi:hypothetical protein